ncbi:MAG: RecQ family ATP-dependent DNA helicase [Oscillospiraceae bacterium]|nr:RecQ family ATP-dependent DNA helicase [Oscillospiraceae bacterium]
MTADETLKKYFGYDSFRAGQKTLIDYIMSGRDVLGILPTGGGKSVCYQVPALMASGMTLVVSPLISLMKDQVNALTRANIAAAFINSSLSERQVALALRNAENRHYKLIYVAPERLQSQSFLAFARSAQIFMVTVDEAHCVSQWGRDFRPSYVKIPEFVAQLRGRPVVSAFTATATPKVQEDIAKLLKLKNPGVLVSGFDRENLHFSVKKPEDKFLGLVEYLKDKKEQSGIVYCSTRSAVEEVCGRLNRHGYKASRYHAGLSGEERQKNQDDFLCDRIKVMAATNAFGMGIDKPNVSFVVHYNMPKDIEGYYQEAGRAGRDGNSAECVLFYGERDVATGVWMIENGSDIEYPDKKTEKRLKSRSHRRLRDMRLYCSTKKCLRRHILKYFGERPKRHCGNCSNCDKKAKAK